MSKRRHGSAAIEHVDSGVPEVLPPLASRARETDQRVWRIARMMSSQQWERGKSHIALAEEWSLAPHTVECLADRAGQVLRLIRAPEAAIQHVLACLHDVLEHAGEPLEKVAAARAILEGYKSFGYKGGAPEASATPPAQAQESLEAELMNPGPELADALERTGWRRVVETTGEANGEE